MNRVLRTIILVCVLVLLVPGLTAAQTPWLEDWLHRVPVDIANPCAVDRANHEVRLLLDASFGFDLAYPDGSDLRVTADDGTTLLDFWIETFDPVGESGCLWVRLPLLPAAGTTVHIYYDRPLTDPVSAADDVFAAYDGFENAVVANPGEWARYAGNPVLVEGMTGAWDDHGATFASVIWDSAAVEFRMYYHGFSGSVHQIGLATSPDGLNWTKYAGNPVMTPGPESWDSGSVRVPMVWKEGADYHMIYTGSGSGGMQVGYATSTDGIAWTKHAANPVFNDPTWATGETENWGVMKVGAEYQMWYSDFGTRQSGLAVSTDLSTGPPIRPNPSSPPAAMPVTTAIPSSVPRPSSTATTTTCWCRPTTPAATIRSTTSTVRPVPTSLRRIANSCGSPTPWVRPGPGTATTATRRWC